MRAWTEFARSLASAGSFGRTTHHSQLTTHSKYTVWTSEVVHRCLLIRCAGPPRHVGHEARSAQRAARRIQTDSFERAGHARVRASATACANDRPVRNH